MMRLLATLSPLLIVLLASGEASWARSALYPSSGEMTVVGACDEGPIEVSWSWAEKKVWDRTRLSVRTSVESVSLKVDGASVLSAGDEVRLLVTLRRWAGDRSGYISSARIACDNGGTSVIGFHVTGGVWDDRVQEIITVIFSDERTPQLPALVHRPGGLVSAETAEPRLN